MTRSLQRDSFRAMGTSCAVVVTADSCDLILARRALHAAQREVTACERALSRFDAYSDLSRLNSASGAWVAVDARLIDALAAALRARRDTRGRFDPTILPALTAAGYDRSFELLRERPAMPLDGWHAGARIDLDPGGGRARVERGAAADLGGIGKGFAATRALDAMRTAWPGLTGALVDLGGDITVWGRPPDGDLWRVDVADPRSPGRVVGSLELADGGVATSGRDTRRFGPGGQLHHLIDPATGTPAVAGPLSVTVVAPSATEAEAYATALAIAEVDDARDQLSSRPDIAALLIPLQGEPTAIGAVPMARERPPARLVVTTQAGRVAWR